MKVTLFSPNEDKSTHVEVLGVERTKTHNILLCLTEEKAVELSSILGLLGIPFTHKKILFFNAIYVSNEYTS